MSARICHVCLRLAAPVASGGSRRPPTGTAVRLMPDGTTTAVVVTALVGIDVVRHLQSDAWWFPPVAAGGLVAFARLSGLQWAELGLSPDRLASGARWGLGGVSVVATVYVAGVLLPSTRTLFLDSRYDLTVPGALLSAFVVIPFGTVLLEEIAFRSVLWGMLARHTTEWQVLAATSALFGLWHILPSLRHDAADPRVSAATGGNREVIGGRRGAVATAAATVGFTALGGVLFGELRRRSGSVLAGAGTHWATNALGVLFGVLARRLAG
jgi:membrane protease YdiL (CAAX protease family)